MKFVALKECGYDRRYYPGEVIDASVIDASIVHKAIEYGFIRKIDEAPLAPEPAVAPEPEAEATMAPEPTADPPAPDELASEDQPEGDPASEAEEAAVAEAARKTGKGKGDA